MSYKRWIIVAIALFGVGLAFGLATPAGIGGILDGSLGVIPDLLIARIQIFPHHFRAIPQMHHVDGTRSGEPPQYLLGVYRMADFAMGAAHEPAVAVDVPPHLHSASDRASGIRQGV